MWSQTADRMGRSIARSRAASLTLTVGGAVLAAMAGAFSDAHPVTASVLAVLAAISLGIVPILRPRWSGMALQDWTRARSVSEALKSEVHLYLARVGDYAGPHRDTNLTASMDLVVRDAGDLLPYTAGVEPSNRDLPDVTDVLSYFRLRVAGQIDGFYRPKAAHMQARLGLFRRLELATVLTAVVLGALAARFPSWGLGVWIAVVTTGTSAVAAHVGSARYEYQLIEYLRTAEELTRIRRAAAQTTSRGQLDDLVVQSERVISIQNEGWMAKLSTDPEVQPAS
ncbi:DUF4231 domain-containing protein [Micromonospora chersina]